MMRKKDFRILRAVMTGLVTEAVISIIQTDKRKYMKAMMLTGIRQMEMREIPEPKIIKPDDVKIKMSVVGICGSDIHYYTQGQIGTQVVEYPFTVGHEGAGIVVETGKDVKRVKPGDAIAIEPAMPCWECDQCLSGRHHTCRKTQIPGLSGPG